MLLKKTLVRFGSILLSTNLDHVSRTLLYAIGRGTSSYSVSPSSNDPRLLIAYITPHKHEKLTPKLALKKIIHNYKVQYNII